MPTAEAKDDGAYAADDKGSKGDDAKGVDTSSIDASKSIVDKVSDYFYLDPSFSDGFEQWAMDHCDAIDLSLDEDANKLECVPCRCRRSSPRRSLTAPPPPAQVHGAVQRLRRNVRGQAGALHKVAGVDHQ